MADENPNDDVKNFNPRSREGSDPELQMVFRQA